MSGVLRGFLGTYTSRYSERKGYWLFGYLVESLNELVFDLLEPIVSKRFPSAEEDARRLAQFRFREQLERHGLSIGMVREMTLIIKKGEPLSYRPAGLSAPIEGNMVVFAVRAVMDNGRVFEDNESIFVAPFRRTAWMRSQRF